MVGGGRIRTGGPLLTCSTPRAIRDREYPPDDSSLVAKCRAIPASFVVLDRQRTSPVTRTGQARDRQNRENGGTAFLSVRRHRDHFIRLYFFNAETTRSPGRPNKRMPSAPVIVCAASIALTTASSVASIVA